MTTIAKLLNGGVAGLLFTAAVLAEDRTVVDWLRTNAIPLATVEAGHGFADLEPLKTLIGNARIVALGEATHGSREIFQVKHRMLEFLASEMGFTIFSMEANMPEAYRLNDYVLTGVGDPEQLLRGLYFWTWDTQEVLDMIRWMREFNRSGKGRIQFTGFDMQTPTVAAEIVRKFLAAHDPALAPSATVASQNAFGVATATLPSASVAGKKVRYTGDITTEGVTRGWAGLWWRIDGPGGVLAIDNLQGRGATGTSDWKQYVIEMPVGANATNINFGVLLTGNGTAWFDDLSVEVDGDKNPDESAFDFGFESAALKGLRAGGVGYTPFLDSHVAHGGTQSFQLRYDAAPPAGVSAWPQILSRLDAARDEYRRKGVPDWDIEWAMQNARVVLQNMELPSAPGVARDCSMAANVKWIADQNARAKIVLWAHNGHVATGGGLGEQTMGSHLRRLFGEDMVVIGTAFNQGAFQAQPFPGETGGPRSVTVPSAPAESLDATFAATNLPTSGEPVRTERDENAYRLDGLRLTTPGHCLTNVAIRRSSARGMTERFRHKPAPGAASGSKTVFAERLLSLRKSGCGKSLADRDVNLEFHAEKMERRLPPGIYFRLLLIGHREASTRNVASRGGQPAQVWQL